MKIIIQKEYDEALFDELKKEFTQIPSVDKDAKIIFLDVDGVLNNRRWCADHKNTPLDHLIDPAAVEKINSICQKTGAKIVISSSWRLQFIDQPNGFNDMKAFFAKFGITNIVGMTPQLRGKPRGDEIRQWLNDHPVANFVIVDDDYTAGVQSRFVKTSFESGLQDNHVEEMIAILEE